MKKQLSKIALLLATAGAVKAQVSFAPAVNYGTSTNPQSVFSVDFNGDGKMDLVTANTGIDNVSVLLGSGTGTFAAAVNYSVGLAPSDVFSADFNGDGKMDIVTANSDGNDVSVLLGSGTGTFSAAGNYAVGLGPVKVFSADFNGDGKMDLATTNYYNNDVSVLIGSGTGTFTASTNYGVGQFPSSVFSADFNGDGKMDLVTANVSGSDVSVLLGSGTGTFSAAVNYSVGLAPSDVFSADFNGDGIMDLVTANHGGDDVSVILGNGDGTFATSVNYGVGTHPVSVVSADFNGDGKKDLVTANYDGNNVSVLLGSGTGTFGAVVNYSVGSSPSSLSSADFNGDGKMDFATANYNSNNISVLLNNTTGASLNFDGTNDFVNIPNNSSFNFGTNDFTIETWAKTTSSTGNKVMIGKISGGNNFWFGVSNGKANFSLIGGPDALGTSTIGDGNWHHIAAVRKSGVVSLYVDGVLEATQNNTGNATINGNLTLGNFSGGFNFPGSLDEVRIWNRGLCKGELLNNKNAELLSSQTGLVAYYKFNQGLPAANNGSEITLNDLSGNANNGTLNNFALTGTTSNWVAPGAVTSGSNAPTYTAVSASAVVSATTICANEVATVTVSATGGTAAYSGVGTYTTNAAANNYTVTDANNCIATAIVNITVNTLPNVTVNSGAICTGQSFTMTPTGVDTYTFSSGSDVVMPTTDATYTVSGIEAATGCSNTAVSSVTVNPLPIVFSNPGNVHACGDVSATFGVSSAGTNTYQWYFEYTQLPNDSGLINGSYTEINFDTDTMTIQQVLTGNYNNYYVYCEVTNQYGCKAYGANDTIWANPSPTISVNSGKICAGQSFTMIPSGANTYSYSNGSNIVMPTVDATYTVTGTDLNGCENTAVSTVTVNALPAISVNSGAICAGQSFTMVPHGASTYSYSNGSDVAMPTVNATYTVTGTDLNGCENTAVSTVTVNALPAISVNSGAICAGQSFTMVPTGAVTYTYSNVTDIVTPSTDATYSVSGTDANGCVSNVDAVSSVTVNALPTVLAISNNTLLCTGQTGSLSVTGASTYTWNTAETTANIAISPTTTTVYTVTGTDANGCQNIRTITQNVSLCTGMTSLVNDASINVYPNPNNGSFVIELTSISKVTVTNALGQVIIAEAYEAGKHTVNINNEATGVYFVKVMTNNRQQIIKIIKE